MINIERGDHVFHRPSRETWIVKGINGDYLEWCGWPPGQAKVSDCLLVRKSTPEENKMFFHPDLA